MNKRIKILQTALGEYDGFLVTSDAGRFYLTGFSSSAGTLLITRNKAVFLIDSRYFEKARSVVSHCEVVLTKMLSAELPSLINKLCIQRLFVEVSSLSVASFENYKKLLPKTEITSDKFLDSAVKTMRSVKSAEEINNIKKAQALTDRTFSYILDKIKPGRSEREIMLDMEFFMRREGSEGVSFDFIVVSGKNSSLPHGVPTEKIIESGDFVTMDFGAVINGYHSDMTRTIAVGMPSDEQKIIYETTLKAQKSAISAVNPGAVCRDIDKIARDIIDAAGYKGCFGHGLGHSVGVEIHESPCFNTTCDTRLLPGMVMTVEPGIYLENKFGVRIEDMLVVTENGFENITSSEKELIIL